ncbi:MAG TPA: protein kinase [Vicinamibacteria bacterium]|nr:protein kinase [Vicinamibacteria bacterium]
MAALAPGSSFGPYRIMEPLGRGGMASVYKAYEAALDRYVAVKVLPAEFLHDPTFAERFRREAKVVARLEHPNIIPIFAFDIEQGTPWMAMRMIGGGSLSAILKQGPLPNDRIVAILAGVAAALDYAHGKGAIHRDVKPQNVLLDEDGRVYLADFGIARMVEVGGGLTQTGMISGTPQYMAPEQATAQNVDHRADIYALGIMAYEMFTGHVPFSADTPVAVLMKHVQEPMPLPPPGSVPEPVVRAILKCTAKQPADRWGTGMEFAHALQEGLGLMPTAVVPALGRMTPGRGTTAVAATAVGQTYVTAPRTGPGMTAPGGMQAAGPAPKGRSGLIALAIAGGIGVLALAGGVLALVLWSQSQPEIPPPEPAGEETPVTVPPLTQPPGTMPEPATDAEPALPPITLPPVTTPAATPRPSSATPRPTITFGTTPPTTAATPEPVHETVPTPPPAPKKVGYPFRLGAPVGIPQLVSGPTTLKSVLFKQSGDELQVEAEAKVGDGKDQKVTVNLALLDGEGRTVMKGQGTSGIEEGETSKVKFKLKLSGGALGSIVGFEVFLSSVPD